MTTTKLTPDTAPRDLEALKKQGRFNLRCLAEELGVFSTEASKTSFMGLDNPGQADAIFKLLKDYDKKNGGGGGKESAEPEAPARQPSNKGAGKGSAKNGAAASASAAPTAGEKIGDGATKILSALQENTAAVGELAAAIDKLTGMMRNVDMASERNIRFTTIALGLSLKLAEEVLQAGPSQIIPAVIDDLPLVEKELAQVAGIAEGGEEEEEDESDPNE